MRDAAGMPALVLMASMVGVGGLARDIGYPLAVAVLSTFLVWAGPAQVLMFGSLAAGMALPAVAVVVSLSSVRFLPMTVSLMPLLREPRRPLWQQLLASHLVAVTNWVEGLRRLPSVPQEQRLAYFYGFGFTTMTAAAIATGAGYFLVGELPPPLAAGLLFTSPMFFSATLLAGVNTVRASLPFAFGFALVPVCTPLIGRDFDLLVVGLVGGTAAYVLRGRQGAS